MSTNRNSDRTRPLSGNDLSRKTQDQESAPLNRPDLLLRTTSMVDVDENLGDSFSKIPELETDGKVAWVTLAAAMLIVVSWPVSV